MGMRTRDIREFRNNMRHTTQRWLIENAGAVLDAVVDAIITIDSHGIIQTVNEAAITLFGYTREQMVGASLSILMPEPYRSRHQSFVDRFLRTGRAQIIGIGRELEAVTADQRQFPIYLAISEINTPDETYFVGIVRDLSQQKAAEEALMEQRNRVTQVGRLSTMGEMTASIAHEINQPLTAIAMYAQASIRLLNQEPPDTARVLQALGKLSEQSLRAGAVIERIQRFVRNESGQREWIDINALLLDLRHLAAGDARLHNIELEFDLSEDLPPLFADLVQIQQVALNLIRNAIDAMHEIKCRNGNQVKVATKLQGASVEVSVIDSGTGVPDEQRADMFKPFHTTKRDGMGMGLSICKSIINDHGGTLQCENNALHGARFFFNLPTGEQS